VSDISLEWAGDLAADANGDLLLTDTEHKTNQRVVRRLLTNAGDYIWNLSYGGGLSLAVGEPIRTSSIEATIRSQLQLEASVATTPAPTVAVQSSDASNGTYVVDIVYSDAISAESRKLSINPR
jgi:hypothetical protein